MQQPYLKCLESVWERLHPDEKGGHYDGWWVVGAVVATCWQISCRVKKVRIKSEQMGRGKFKIKKVESWKHTITLRVLHLFISLDEHLSPFLRLSSHWFRKVTESCRVWQIQCLSRSGINLTSNHFYHPLPSNKKIITNTSCCVMLPLIDSQLGPRERLDIASDHCTSSQQWCSDASGTQSYLFPLSGWQK